MNNSRILAIKNAKFSGYYFHMNLNIQGGFQICISVPLNISRNVQVWLSYILSSKSLSLVVYIFGATFCIILRAFFFISSTFISDARLKSAKNQANAKQHPEAGVLLFENYPHCSCENNRTYSRKQAKEQVCLGYTIN